MHVLMHACHGIYVYVCIYIYIHTRGCLYKNNCMCIRVAKAFISIVILTQLELKYSNL